MSFNVFIFVNKYKQNFIPQFKSKAFIDSVLQETTRLWWNFTPNETIPNYLHHFEFSRLLI